jgi:hypothetical protein
MSDDLTNVSLAVGAIIGGIIWFSDCDHADRKSA